jgi:exodeoxyribonuclease V alpha subunit
MERRHRAVSAPPDQRRRQGHSPGRALEVIEGVIEGVRFQSAETGFTVLVTVVEGRDEVLVGELPGPVEKGASFVAHGRWGTDAKHGRQFRFEILELMAPTTTDQVVARLKTYPGIGPATAVSIVEQFGERTWEVLDNDVDDLRYIPGLGPKALAKIRAHHKRQHGPVAQLRNRMIAVKAPQSLAKAIHEEFGDRSMKMLDDHPFLVARKIPRFGFGLANRFAHSTGLDPETDERVDAGIVHALRMLRMHGHSCMPYEELVLASAHPSVLGVGERVVEAGIDRLLKTGELRDRRRGMMFLSTVDRVEERVARAIEATCRPVRGVWDVGELPDSLSPGQREAVESVARSGVTVLTGGPGTGKSTVVAAVLEMAERAGVDVILCAPTGRAARRMTEATGRQASTVHRLLRPIPGSRGFHHDEGNPLGPGLIVVDEVSMVDLELADALLGAVTSEHRLLLVGDADQLPSVGAGDLLRDIIDAADAGANISVVRLARVFRQVEGSTIITNAHRLLAGEDLVSDDPGLGSSGQFYIIPAKTPELAQAKILKMASIRVPDAYGLDPAEDVQILCPMHGGPTGTEEFNSKLQRLYGRRRAAFWAAKRRFCVDDRVMQMRNDYERNVFNGDVGSVIDFDETFLTVDFDGSVKRYKRFDVRSLQLAYAMTIHKSQGGEFPAVLIPVFRSRMLNRHLLYTAITRAKELCVLVGSVDAIRSAVRTASARRWTCLSHRITATN